MATKNDETKNRVTIDLKSGYVEVASDKEPLNICVKTAERIAKKLTSKNVGEWGIQ